MQHHHSGGGDYSQIQPCGHFWGRATLEDACCMVDLMDAKPCKYINIKGDEVKHKQASHSSCYQFILKDNKRPRWEIREEVWLTSSTKKDMKWKLMMRHHRDASPWFP